jgi:mono/diheme cytochrome c family protein
LNATTIAIGILALAGVVVLILLLANANRGRRAIEDVPPGMRPAYSDEQLERSVLERYMAWGLVMTLFFAVFFPLYWLREEGRLNAEQETFFVEDVVRGEDEYVQLCAECHGPAGGGGAAPSPYGEGSWPAPAMVDIAARYADHTLLAQPTELRTFIEQTIQRGRPGTPMPTWGAAYGGPLTDQQIDSIVDWILATQVDDVEDAEGQDAEGEDAEGGEGEDAEGEGEDAEGEDAEAEETAQATNVSGEELFTQNCAKCHGDDAAGRMDGTLAPSLLGVFDRHAETTILGILRNGIIMPAGGPIMPPWQNGYMYPDSRLSDEELEAIVDYLRELGGGEGAVEAEETDDTDDTEDTEDQEVDLEIEPTQEARASQTPA